MAELAPIITQAELARRLGWNRQSVSKWLKVIGVEAEQIPGMPHTYIPAHKADEVCRRLREARANRANDGKGSNRKVRQTEEVARGMTVGDLITELSAMDPYMTVGAVVSYGREGEAQPHPLTVLEVTHAGELGTIVILHTGQEV